MSRSARCIELFARAGVADQRVRELTPGAPLVDPNKPGYHINRRTSLVAPPSSFRVADSLAWDS
jgi:hypothetical protein